MAAISAATFDALSQAIDVTLVPHGFVPLRVERNGPFGSHYSVFAKESTAYRIVWDGKESWLGAEVSDNFGGGGTSN